MRRTVLVIGVFAVAAVISVCIVIGDEVLRVWQRRDFPRQKRAIADLQTLALVLDRVAEEQGRYPTHEGVLETGVPRRFHASSSEVWPKEVEQGIDTVAPQLAAHFRTEVPTRDPWGKVYVYAVTPDGRHYVLISLGSDGKLDRGAAPLAWDSGESWRDIVVVDGEFVSYPYGISVAKPELAPIARLGARRGPSEWGGW